ncbi:MAG: hypothetical protein PHC61_00515 [Chitinivibrionales bacterium]|nr:hypothetical protein [Chitinivibrionales bacterium]
MKLNKIKKFSYVASAMLVFGAIALATIHCNSANPLDIYQPAFAFSGIMGSDSVVLPGNFFYPNHAAMIADTLRIVCYSSYYSEGRVNVGFQLRLDIYRPGHDTLFGIKDMLFRLAQYDTNGFNRTYQLDPGDSNNTSGYSIQLKIKAFGAAAGSALNISIPYVYPYQYPANSAKRSDNGAAFTIKRATIIGHMS